MKKMVRMACLAAALVASGYSTAGAALPLENCYYYCGHVESVTLGSCCSRNHRIDGGSPMYSDTEVCPLEG